MPYADFNKFVAMVKELDPSVTCTATECKSTAPCSSHADKMPDVMFQFGTSNFTIPPDAYMLDYPSANLYKCRWAIVWNQYD